MHCRCLISVVPRVRVNHAPARRQRQTLVIATSTQMARAAQWAAGDTVIGQDAGSAGYAMLTRFGVGPFGTIELVWIFRLGSGLDVAGPPGAAEHADEVLGLVDFLVELPVGPPGLAGIGLVAVEAASEIGRAEAGGDVQLQGWPDASEGNPR